MPRHPDRNPPTATADSTMYNENIPDQLIPDGGASGTPNDEFDGEQDSKETKTIMIELSRTEYDQLTEVKKSNGFTWKGMLIHAKRNLPQDSCDSSSK